MTPEGKLKKTCRNIARKRGLIFWNIEGKGINGIPDTICGKLDGGIAFVEFKRPDGNGVVSDQQFKRIAELHAVGVDAFVIDSEAGYRAVIEGTAL